jgi:ABC-type sugar transport system permease subunit
VANKDWRRRRDAALPYLLLAPALVLLVGMVYPFCLGVYYSLTNYWLQYPKRFRFIWFDNYISLVSEPLFARALGFTLGFTVVAVVVQGGLGSRWRCSCTHVYPDARHCAR